MSQPEEGTRSRSQSLTGCQDQDDPAEAPPMTRAITRLWCHEVTRVFGDRLLLDEGIYAMHAYNYPFQTLTTLISLNFISLTWFHSLYD